MESKQHPAKFAKGREKLDGVLVAEVTNYTVRLCSEFVTVMLWPKPVTLTC